jgi:LPS export ABC transporter protein LptC
MLCLLLAELTTINFHKLELPKDKPEFFATGITANIYESNGGTLYHVIAESAQQYPDSDKVIFSNLTFNAFDKTTKKLAQQLTSADGWVDTKNKNAFLGNNVKMVNLAKLESENIILNTHNVNIDTENKMISTAADIKAVQGQSVLTGVGASFNYESQFLTIKSKVKIIYVTNQ